MEVDECGTGAGRSQLWQASDRAFPRWSCLLDLPSTPAVALFTPQRALCTKPVASASYQLLLPHSESALGLVRL